MLIKLMSSPNNNLFWQACKEIDLFSLSNFFQTSLKR